MHARGNVIVGESSYRPRRDLDCSPANLLCLSYTRMRKACNEKESCDANSLRARLELP